MTSLHLPWTPYRHGNKYYVMGSHSGVIAEVTTKEAALFICQSAYAHYDLTGALQDFVDRLDAEDVGEAEGNHVQIWESMHGRAIKSLEDAGRRPRIAGEDY